MTLHHRVRSGCSLNPLQVRLQRQIQFLPTLPAVNPGVARRAHSADKSGMIRSPIRHAVRVVRLQIRRFVQSLKRCQLEAILALCPMPPSDEGIE
jgi:hypothetical protein